MNIEEARKHLKKNLNNWKKSKKDNGYMPEIMEEINTDYEAIETLLTAYEKEKRLAENHKTAFEKQTENLHEVEELYEKEKEKNKKIDESCRKELAFERRLKRENREPDEFNQGRFYVSENIRKIIEEE